MFLIIYNNVPFACDKFEIAQKFLLKCIEEESVIDDWSEDYEEVMGLKEETNKIWSSKDGNLSYYKLEYIQNIPNNVNRLCKSFPYY